MFSTFERDPNCEEEDGGMMTPYRLMMDTTGFRRSLIVFLMFLNNPMEGVPEENFLTKMTPLTVNMVTLDY